MSTPSWVRTLHTTRTVVLGSLLVFSAIGLATSAAYLSFLEFITEQARVPQAPAEFAVAIPVVTLVLIVPIFIVDFVLRGAFTSMIVVELPVLGLLSALWLVDAAWSSSLLSQLQPTCGMRPGRYLIQAQVDLIHQVCTYTKLTVAFGWLTWILLLAYFPTLLTVSIIGSRKGASVWKLSVRNCDFGYGSSSPPANKLGAY